MCGEEHGRRGSSGSAPHLNFLVSVGTGGRGCFSLPPPVPLGVGNPHLTPEVSRAPCTLISPPNSLTPAGDNSIDIRTHATKPQKPKAKTGLGGRKRWTRPGVRSRGLSRTAQAEGSAATAGRSEPGSQCCLFAGLISVARQGRTFSTISRPLSHSPWRSRCGGLCPESCCPAAPHGPLRRPGPVGARGAKRRASIPGKSPPGGSPSLPEYI